jgi:hypothetical protein
VSKPRPTQSLDRIYTQRELEDMDVDELDILAYGCKGGDIISFKPSELRIKWKEDLGNPQYKFEQGGMAWVRSVTFDETVEVSVNEDGVFELENGHHRWFAATKLGLELKAVIEVKGNPVRTILARQENALKAGQSTHEVDGYAP